MFGLQCLEDGIYKIHFWCMIFSIYGGCIGTYSYCKLKCICLSLLIVLSLSHKTPRRVMDDTFLFVIRKGELMPRCEFQFLLGHNQWRWVTGWPQPFNPSQSQVSHLQNGLEILPPLIELWCGLMPKKHIQCFSHCRVQRAQNLVLLTFNYFNTFI